MHARNGIHACVEVNSSPSGQTVLYFADIFKWIFLNEFFFYFNSNFTEVVSTGPIDNEPVLVPVMAWRRTGDKPLHEPTMTQFTDAYMRHYLVDELTNLLVCLYILVYM